MEIQPNVDPVRANGLELHEKSFIYKKARLTRAFLLELESVDNFRFVLTIMGIGTNVLFCII